MMEVMRVILWSMCVLYIKAHCPCPAFLPPTDLDFIVNPDLSYGYLAQIRGSRFYSIKMNADGSTTFHSRPIARTVEFDVYKNKNYNPACGRIFWRRVAETAGIIPKLSSYVQCQNNNTFCATYADIITWQDMAETCDGPQTKGDTFQVAIIHGYEDFNRSTYMVKILKEIRDPKNGTMGEVDGDTFAEHLFNQEVDKFMDEDINCCPGVSVIDIGQPRGSHPATLVNPFIYPGEEGCQCFSGDYGCYICDNLTYDDCLSTTEFSPVDVCNQERYDRTKRSHKRKLNKFKKSQPMCMSAYEIDSGVVYADKFVTSAKECKGYDKQRRGKCDVVNAKCDWKNGRCVECSLPICRDDFQPYCPSEDENGGGTGGGK